MSLIPITQYGDLILRKVVKPVQKIDDEVIEIIQNMFSTMRNANGIGLAGNQVGLDKQIFVVDVSPVEGYEHIKPIVMIASCPLILLTLGLATLVVNTALFYLAGWIGRMFDFGFIIPQQTFYYAFLGALIVSAVSYILNRIFDTSR